MEKTPKPEVRLLDTLKFHWGHATRFKKLITANFIVGPLVLIADRYIAPLFIAALLSAIQFGNATLENSLWLIVGFASIQLITFVIGYRINLFLMWTVQALGVKNINQEAFEAITRHSLQFHNNRFAGSLVSQVNKASGAFFSFWSMAVNEVLFVLVSVVATVIGISFISWPLAVILMIFVVIYTIAAYFGTRFLRPRQVARSKANSKISGQLSDAITNMVAVKIESKEKAELKRLSHYIDTWVEKDRHVRKGIMTTSTVMSLIIALSRISALVVAVWAVQAQAVDAGAVYLLMTYAFNLLSELWNINTTFRAMYQISGDTEEILSIMREPVSIVNISKKKLRATKGEVVLNDIMFAHEDDKPLFTNLSLTIPAGQKVGIVGVSGSGKTTLTKLLLRLIDPQSGSITIDGQDIANVTQESLHNAIAYVPQEPLLFHRSIEENIAYARPNAPMHQIKKAAKDAQAHDFIEALPDSFDTLVGERGVKLSGGQRQRVAVARAILKDSPVLILDEATSALDSENEALIQKALGKLMQGRTSIIIAHRLSTIAKLDRIIVMKNGKIIEDGSHRQLLAKSGQYAKLWAHQSGGFLEE